ncbi:dTDP-4-dehydrorhamnose reductase [Alcanivorax sp. 1008]|uniref:dTDP-4-dehydrorhamnose reductase n=1 Tax=Alcanivorax sp. 1008 TaxID=2816853 RepID=UPI001D529B65|nr:dTDP-4-dehydrorhamnose reductase [Alcanivorax sp. 1008]MCC1495741.1 dTDP-4-dehydrorhamnose reductase [Alcanivorax sp. 1008]
MRVLLFGKNGQVGWELQRSLASTGELIALDRQGEDGLCGDLGNLPGLTDTLERLQPDIIVNAAAYTAVDKAEQEAESAQLINAQAPKRMAQWAAKTGALLVHYSTDYVFDGSGDAPYSEDAPVAPINIYGQTKLAGEKAIQKSGCRYLIFRTSWVYAAQGNNFMKTMLQLGKTRAELNVVCDQIGAPTPARLVAEITALSLSRQLASGIYHLSASGHTSWHGFAQEIFRKAIAAGEQLSIAADKVQPIPSSAYPVAARRPLNSRLATDKLRSVLGIDLPDWQSQLEHTLKEHLKDRT